MTSRGAPKVPADIKDKFGGGAVGKAPEGIHRRTAPGKVGDNRKAQAGKAKCQGDRRREALRDSEAACGTLPKKE